jgi:hypothetical protein
VTVTLAPETAEPLASVTVPEMLPVACPSSLVEMKSKEKKLRTTDRDAREVNIKAPFAAAHASVGQERSNGRTQPEDRNFFQYVRSVLRCQLILAFD